MPSHPPKLYGPDGRPLIKVRDRLVPPPRAGAGIDGWVEWSLIDRKGRVVQGGEQHNLILNGFMNLIATTSLTAGLYTNGTLNGALSHFAVGTGSTTPAVTDTSLDSEVSGRTTTLITNTVTRTANGVYAVVLEREFDFAQGNGNLTEFGFAGGAATDILVRELFRNAGGTPITITKTSAYKLRIKYTQTVTLTPTFDNPDSHSVAIAGIGTVGGIVGWVGSTAGRNADFGAFSALAAGKATQTQGDAIGGNFVPAAYTSTVGGYTYNSILGNRTPSTYTPGTFERSADIEFPTDKANGTIASIAVGGVQSGLSYVTAGLIFLIDSGDRFTKDNLHSLSFTDAFTVTWARA